MLFAALVLVLAAGPPEIDTAKSALKALEHKHGVDIVWEEEFHEETPNWAVHTKRGGTDHLVEFAPLLAAAMAIYPAKVWESGKIEKIYLVKDCRRNGVQWNGFAVRSREALLLDISGDATPEWFRTAFHHELFHMIDPIADEDWTKLNMQDFVYRPVERPSGISVKETQKGFLNAYSRVGAVEDKAEVFAYMVADPQKVKAQVESDWILRQKVAAMKSRMATFGLDAEWWRKRGL